MKNVSFLKMILAGVVTGLTILGTTESGAIQKPLLASIEVLDQIPILLVQDTQLDFGKIIPPVSGVRIFTVSPEGVGSPKTPGPDGFIVSDEQRGLINATGEVGAAFTVSSFVGPTPCTLAGTTLTSVAPVVTSPTFPSQIKVGGTLNVNAATVSAGTGTCAYTLDVNYN